MARGAVEEDGEGKAAPPRRGPGPFALVVALLLLLLAGGAAWLQLTYEAPPPAPAAQQSVELALPAAPVQSAAAEPPASAEPSAEPPPSAPSPPVEAAPPAAAPSVTPDPSAEVRSTAAAQEAPPAPSAPLPPAAPTQAAPSPVAPPSPSPAPLPAQAPAAGAPAPPAPTTPTTPAAAPAASPASEPSGSSLAPQPERQAALTPPHPPAETWRAFAQPFEARSGLPRIAIVVWDLGLSPEPTRAAIKELPPEVTLGFAPYGADLQKWADQARAAGHEVLLQAPMEPERFPENDPGPHTLLTGLAPAENLERLDWVLGRFKGYVGVVNYMGSRFTASPGDLRPVLAHLKERGLIFLDSRAGAQSVADRLAAELGLAHAANTRYLDNEASRLAIEARLEELERAARERGWAVGIGYHYPVTIDRLVHWAKTLPAKGVQLAPLSAVVRQEAAGRG